MYAIPHRYSMTSDLEDWAVEFRGTSNILPFMSSEYNEAGVKTTTPKDRQVIFMDAKFNAKFDVGVLASAFNMDKADFMGRLFLIDKWNEFDNDRFDIIRANSDGLEEVTDDELTLMNDVVAVICDENWFQVYDNNNKFTEKYIASGLYWNYFYHTWKTISYSPFANAIVFSDGVVTVANSVDVIVDSISTSDTSIVVTFGDIVPNSGTPVRATTPPSIYRNHYEFVQTEELTELGVAVQKYGALIIPNTEEMETAHINLEIKVDGTSLYNTTISGTSYLPPVGSTLTFDTTEPGGGGGEE